MISLLLATFIHCDMLSEMAWQTANLRNSGYPLERLLNEPLDTEVIYYIKGIYAGKYGKEPILVKRNVYKECSKVEI